MNIIVKMKNRNTNPSSDARAPPRPGDAKKYAAAPSPNAINNASANPANIPTNATTRLTTARRDRIELRNSVHFNHTRAKS
jgi:hypothetical protein